MLAQEMRGWKGGPLHKVVKMSNPDFPGDPVVRESSCQCRGHRFPPWSGKIHKVQLSPCTYNS